MTSEQKQLNKTGIYLRLSKDDERMGESLSIDNQRLILRKYVTEHGGTIIDEYVDDGYSGTNFERPGVQRLLEDAKTGKIDTIIVKDLSRFGRNYIQVGQYTDYIFPAYGIRFIALNDNVDTSDVNSAGMDMMPIMNIFNEWHSANTSKKIRAVLEASQRSGKYTSGIYPYGYIAGTDENRSAIVDEPAAKIVRRIFDMRIQGYSPYRIARVLSDEGVPNPTEYRTRKDGGKIDREVPHWWSHKTINDMLNDMTYLGYTVQHRRHTISYKNHKTVYRPESEWIVKENAHEPIISKEVWQKAQEIKASVARDKVTKSSKVYPLSGLLYCEDCGRKMKLSKSYTVYKGKRTEFIMYLCRTYATLGKNYCTTHGIKVQDIEAVVLADIRSMLSFIESDETKARNEFLKNKARRSTEAKAEDERQIKNAKKRLAELDLLIQSAFEEKVLKNMPESVCIALCDKYQKEKETVEKTISELEIKLADESKDQADVDEYIRRIKQYGKCEKLTREMCLQLIEFITVDAKKVHNNRWHPAAPRNIHIYYKLIDKETPNNIIKSEK
ncbi:MAG: recombinase family protein [Candidatus Coproplasma sp.]